MAKAEPMGPDREVPETTDPGRTSAETVGDEPAHARRQTEAEAVDRKSVV